MEKKKREKGILVLNQNPSIHSESHLQSLATTTLLQQLAVRPTHPALHWHLADEGWGSSVVALLTQF